MRLLTLICVLCGSIVHSPNVKLIPGRAEAVPADFFGMHINYAPVTPFPVDLGVGAGRLHDSLNFSMIRSTNGAYDWRKFDSVVSYWKAGHVNDLMFTLTIGYIHTPSWATVSKDTAGPFASNDVAREFVEQVVRRYCGDIRSYQIWNEPNGKVYWDGSPADLAQLAQIIVPVIRNPSNCACTEARCAPALPGGRSPNRVIAAGPDHINVEAGKSIFASRNFWKPLGVDVMDFHAYGVEPNPELMLDSATLLVHQAGMPVWVTEGGWGRQASLPDPSDEAAFVARWYLTLWMSGVQRAYWYAYDNNANDGMGGPWGQLWKSDTGMGAPGVAYRQISRWMVGAVMTGCSRDYAGVWVCSFRRQSLPTYIGYIVWNEGGSGTWVVPSGIRVAETLRETSFKVTAGTTVTVTKTPLLYQSRDLVAR